MNKLAEAIQRAQNGKSKMRSGAEESFLWLLKNTTDRLIPEPAFKFLVDRRFEFDFAWADLKIAVEIEGGVWRRGGGAHSHPTNILRDIEKYNLATLAGWRIFRITTDMVQDGRAMALVNEMGIPKRINLTPTT